MALSFVIFVIWLIYLYKAVCCVGLCLAWEKAPGEFDDGELILIGFFAFDSS